MTEDVKDPVAVFEPFDEFDERCMTLMLQESAIIFDGLCEAMGRLGAAPKEHLPAFVSLPLECLPLIYGLVRSQLIARGIVDAGSPAPGVFRAVISEEEAASMRERQRRTAELEQMNPSVVTVQ